jgi:hypothetical protein
MAQQELTEGHTDITEAKRSSRTKLTCIYEEKTEWSRRNKLKSKGGIK